MSPPPPIDGQTAGGLSPDDVDAFFRSAVTIELGLGFVAVILGWLTGVNVHQWLPPWELASLSPIAVAILGGVVAALPMLLVVEIVERIDWAPFRELQELDQSPIVATLLRMSPAELITISIAAGVGEELLLRGWLMAWLIGPPENATFGLIVMGLITSSIAFGLMHPITPAYFGLATLIGLYFGILVLWTENLLVAITAHAVYDAVHLLLSRRSKRTAAQVPADPESSPD